MTTRLFITSIKLKKESLGNLKVWRSSRSGLITGLNTDVNTYNQILLPISTTLLKRQVLNVHLQVSTGGTMMLVGTTA